MHSHLRGLSSFDGAPATACAAPCTASFPHPTAPRAHTRPAPASAIFPENRVSRPTHCLLAPDDVWEDDPLPQLCPTDKWRLPLLYARCPAGLAPGLRSFAVISFPSFGASLHRSLLSCGARCSPAPSCPISDPQTTATSGTACRNGAQRIGSPVGRPGATAQPREHDAVCYCRLVRDTSVRLLILHRSTQTNADSFVTRGIIVKKFGLDDFFIAIAVVRQSLLVASIT
jgi:hypothetical protein